MGKAKEDMNKKRTMLYSWQIKLIIVKMVISPPFSVIPHAVLESLQGIHGASAVAQQVKNPPQCRRHRRCEFDPWIARSPAVGTWLPTPVFLPVKPHGQRSRVGYSPEGHQK